MFSNCGSFLTDAFRREWLVDLHLVAGIKKGDSVLPWLTSLDVGFVQRAWEFPFVTCCDGSRVSGLPVVGNVLEFIQDVGRERL